MKHFPKLLLCLALFVFIFSCNKNDAPFECAVPAIVPHEPYSDPVWHPNGQLLGFNHKPLAGVSENGIPPCKWFMNYIKPDSVGFYLINRDGTGFKRVTSFYLQAPSWSPDGKWLAFSLGPNIYKMPFDGTIFDTTKIIKLTTSGGNYYPGWTSNSDTIYYDSNNDAPAGTSFYSIWKMTSDGSGKLRVTLSAGVGDTRQPFIGSDNRVYYVGYSKSQPEILSMYKDGTTQIQITNNGKNGARRNPKHYKGKVFFWDGRLFSTPVTQYIPEEIALSGETYDISRNGEIVYPTFEYGILDKRFGTLWLINATGNNKTQLTFNHY